MADNPDAHPAKEATIAVTDTAHAPFVFFEMAPAFGHTNGVVNVTLSANRSVVGPDGIINEQVVVAYLRGNESWLRLSESEPRGNVGRGACGAHC